MSKHDEIATEALIGALIDGLGQSARVSIAVIGFADTLVVEDATSSGGLLKIESESRTLLIKESAVTAVDIRQPLVLDMDQIGFGQSTD